VKVPNATRRADLIFVHAPWPNACLKRINALLTVISSLTEKNGDFMKAPHADPKHHTIIQQAGGLRSQQAAFRRFCVEIMGPFPL
jgi:hypothetical protein